MLKEVSQESIAEMVSNRLRDEIDNGYFKPGDRLVEQDICNVLQVSRTPVREAFRILQAEGYLTYRPRFGVFVTELQLKELEDIWELRVYLEKRIAYKTAQRADDALKKQIREEMHKITMALQQTQIPQKLFYTLDETYYAIHVTNCGNQRMTTTAQNLRVNSELFRRKIKFNQDRVRVSLESIYWIYQAFIDNDGALAEQKLEEHFLATFAELKKSL